jgi:hypothetical protein
VLTMLRRFEDKDDRVRRRLQLTLTDGASNTEVLIDKLVEHDVLATLEGWDREGARRHLVLGLRLPRKDGEQRLLAALESEPGIARMQLDPPAG